MPARVPVTAVLVAHDGSRWLPDALAALAAQTVTPARVVAVDAGSADDSAALLRRATGSVLELPRDTSYAAAVATALASVPADTRWVWLLHDDCAPDPDALSALLRQAALSPSAAVLGPKAVDWHDTRVLVEIGSTTDGSGVRDHGIEPGELDQGQHDTVREVLAVGTAGALVRRDVWDALGGLDAELAGFRDDLDLGWRANAAGSPVLVVPGARIRHVRAATTGRRRLAWARGGAAAVDRAAALQVVLAHAPGWRLAPALLRLALGCLLRGLGLLLGRRPREAADELRALLTVLARPRRLQVMRRARAATRSVPAADLRPLMCSPAGRVRARVAALAERGGNRAVPGLDVPEAAQDSPLRTRPGVVLAMSLLGIAVLAEGTLLGRGVLAGGRLVAAPGSASDLWSSYAATAEPAWAVLGALATVLLGSAGLAVDLLLLACVPISGVVAYVVAGRLVRHPLLQVWAGATWALLPVATGAVSGGRLGAAAVHAALPALMLLGLRVAAADPRREGWSRAWGSGLALTALVALAPVLWPLSVLLLVGTGLVRVAAAAPALRPAARRRALACALAAAVPGVLLLPWSPSLLSTTALLHGPGRLATELVDPALPAWHLLLLQPGGPGTPLLLLGVPVLLAALGGLLRTRRARVAAAAWAVAVTGLAAALVLTRTSADGFVGWPGVPLDVAAAGMLVAALVGAEGLQESLARSSFGWRQLTAVLVVVTAAAVPFVSAVDWVRRGADGPLNRTDGRLLPAFVAAELAADPDRRALLLAPRPDGTVAYAFSDADGPRLGDPLLAEDDLVTELLSPRGTDASAAAAARGVAFIAVPGESSSLAAGLDAQPGLDRESTRELALWRVVPTSRPVPTSPDRLGPAALTARALALLAVAVLAGPGLPRRRGLVRESRR